MLPKGTSSTCFGFCFLTTVWNNGYFLNGSNIRDKMIDINKQKFTKFHRFSFLKDEKKYQSISFKNLKTNPSV